MANEAPSADADAIFIPGGYPELHAGRIAAAERFMQGLRQAAADGTTIYGECGGYMVLGQMLIDRDARPHRMAGLLPVVTSFERPSLHLGYRHLAIASDGPLGRPAHQFRGHEFHYASEISRQGEPLFRVRDARKHDLGEFGCVEGSVCGSFVHLVDRFTQLRLVE
jgi:cobyrinic acid a,c-diamide synthase